MSFSVTNSVKWVGVRDWDLETFHGEELSTFEGSTYNSYLIRDEKTVLIDTVWSPFTEEFIHNLKEEIDLNEIDYIVANHAEVDHSGALPQLMREIPDTPIYCTKNGVDSLQGQYHEEWNFETVQTGDTLDLGSMELIFVEAPMLHWPDSMMCYLTNEEILFSNDAFGQHYSTSAMYNDQVDQTQLYREAIKYYANILGPFSPLVKNKIEEFQSLDLPLDMICPSHGVIWRDNPTQIIEQYMQWADNYQENQISIIYDTMWESTRQMAQEIAAGITDADPEVTVKLLNSSKRDKNEIITEVFRSKAILVGSPTVNRGILFSVSGILDMIKGMKFADKKASAFGSFGWSGESPSIVKEELQEAGFEIVSDEISQKWTPDAEAAERLVDFGADFADKIE